jgi:carboxypeptidase PM20D1
MRKLGRIGLALLGVVVFVASVVAYRTVTYRAPGAVDFSRIRIAEAPPIDVGQAAGHLAEAVRIRTVSHQEAREDEVREWERLHAWLQSTYPRAHAAMTREVVADRGLLYTWPGTDPSLEPVVLMAHQDVVPVDEGTEKDWKYPPFDGVVADGAVWGRGTFDDKGSLVGLFEAAEALASSGFRPRRTVIIISGHDEEVGGSGVRAAAALLKSRHVTAAFSLDEGMCILTGVLSRPVALVGVAEKGFATLKVTAPATGGHSSAPPPETGVEVLARAVLAITSRPFPMRFAGPVADMTRALAPAAGTVATMAVANEWLFTPLLVRAIASDQSGAAGLHTTIAPTMLQGSPKDNLLPQHASAWINYRIAPGDTMRSVMERARAATSGLRVTLAWDGQANDPPPVSSIDSDGYRLIAALASEGGRVPVAPALTPGTTDSRWLVGVVRHIYRFAAVVISPQDIEMVHGTNERMTLANLKRMTTFYARLIATAAR